MPDTTREMIDHGGDIGFPEIAALSIATVLWLSRGNDKILEEIGSIADEIKERFINGDTSGN